LITLLFTGTATADNGIHIHPSEEQHVIELNSNQPYVAGFHVNTEDLRTRGTLNAASITVCFKSVETNSFPESAWLGGGMFIQAQDSKLLHIDYGFYMMVVIDANGRLFVDLGLHQTREFSVPFQNPPSELIYAYTWEVTALASSIPATISAHWDEEGTIHYYLFAEQTNVSLISINVPSLPNCESIIRKFYAGNTNVCVNSVPMKGYVNFFQFGIVSSETITDSPWIVSLRNPMILKTGRIAVAPTKDWKTEGEKGWVPVDKAWTVQGDNSFLDADWKWGGKPYYGAEADVCFEPSEDLREVLFSYTGYTMKPGTILWGNANLLFSDNLVRWLMLLLKPIFGLFSILLFLGTIILKHGKH
jgi:hypothetical protein